jgi:DNA recombination protein RmuC
MKDVRMKEAAGIIQTEVLTMLQDVDRLDKRVDHLEKHFQLAEKDIKDIRTSADKVKKRGDKIQDIQLDEVETAAIESAVEDTLGEAPLLRSVE